MKNTMNIFATKIILMAFFLLPLTGCVFNIGNQGLSPLYEKVLEGEGKDKILVIEITGPIFDKEKRSFSGGVLKTPITSRIREELDRARQDKNVKGIILRINSPGGAVTPCDIINHEIKKFKEETGIFVLAQFLNMAASGGYYIGVAADEIMAHPTSITGAVGVISVSTGVTELMKKIGLETRTFKSADKKDMISPFREMTKEEIRIYQAVINELFDKFKEEVKLGRPNMNADAFKILTDGRILSSKKALELGAIDSIGYMDDAIEAVKKATGLEEALVITYGRSGSYKANVFSKGSGGVDIDADINLINIDTDILGGESPFNYLWVY